MIKNLAALILIAVAPPAIAAPDFVPSPSQAFKGFVAINAPRPEVPVGALWVDGYGPTGDGAAAENLETVRSLNGLVIDRDLQLSLTSGLFNLIGIEPTLRSNYSARFTDLSIVRVKNMDRLPGPKGELRIIEALTAGSITVTSGRNASLNGRTIFYDFKPVVGTSTNGAGRMSSIEGRDLFIALRVATLRTVRSKEKLVRVRETGATGTARSDDLVFAISNPDCAGRIDGCAQQLTITVSKAGGEAGTPEEKKPFDSAETALIALPVPRSDGEGGLYHDVEIVIVPKCSVRKSNECDNDLQLRVHFVGERLQTLPKPSSKSW